MNNKRNWKDPQYLEWRTFIRKRDKHKCLSCGSRKKTQCHHIKPWSDFPVLRYAKDNGILLCKVCHSRIWSNEAGFASYCLNLINQGNGGDSVYEILRKYEEDNETGN